jgi:hypothetical protein
MHDTLNCLHAANADAAAPLQAHQHCQRQKQRVGSNCSSTVAATAAFAPHAADPRLNPTVIYPHHPQIGACTPSVPFRKSIRQCTAKHTAQAGLRCCLSVAAFCCQVHQQVEQLQQQRQQQLAPSRLYLPPPWQLAVFEQPTPMFMVSNCTGSLGVTHSSCSCGSCSSNSLRPAGSTCL